MKYSTVIALLLANTSAIKLRGDDKPGQKDIGLSADLAFQKGRQVSADVVAAQQKFEANHTSTHAKAMATAAQNTLDTKTSVWVPRNAVYLQTEGPDDDKKPVLQNMGTSSDVAFLAGRAQSEQVVAAQEQFMARANADHAKAMATAAAKATADKTNVWVPRNAVYLQTQDDAPKMPNMGIASDKAFQEGRKEAQAIIEKQNSIQSAQNTAHAKAMYDARVKAYNDNVAVWAPRNAVFAQYEGLPNMGNSQRVSHDSQTAESLKVVANQQKFAADHLAAHEAATAKAADLTSATMHNVWIPRNAVFAQKTGMDNFGDAQRVAHDKQTAETNEVVADQQAALADWNATHAEQTAKHAAATEQQMNDVWNVANRAHGRGYLAQINQDGLPDMGDSQRVARDEYDEDAKTVVKNQKAFAASFAAGHAERTADDAAMTKHAMERVWDVRNRAFGRGYLAQH